MSTENLIQLSQFTIVKASSIIIISSFDSKQVEVTIEPNVTITVKGNLNGWTHIWKLALAANNMSLFVDLSINSNCEYVLKKYLELYGLQFFI